MGSSVLKQREVIVSYVVALMLLNAAFSGLFANRDARDERARADVGADLALAVGSVQRDTADVVEDARLVALEVSTSGRFVESLARATSPAAAGVSFAGSDADTFDIEGDQQVTAADLGPARAALEAARDAAQPRMLPPIGDAELVFVAAPAFLPAETDGGAAETGGSAAEAGGPAELASTAERRQRFSGYVLVRVDNAVLATRAAPPGTSVSVQSGGSVARTFLDGGSAVGSSTTRVAGAEFTVTASIDRVTGVSVAEVGWGLLSLLAAGGVVVAGMSAASRRCAAAAAAASASDQLHLMTSLAPIVQETLDLGRVLPEIAGRLRDELDLAGIGFATPTAEGRMRNIYLLGIVDEAEAVANLGMTLRAGESAAVVLHRGGRTVGMLRVKARRDLSGDELDALRGAGELATAAILSGQLFEQQDEALRRLREVDDLKTAFLSTASHELRTPVAAIKGFSKLLDESWDGAADADRVQYASRIRANATVLETLVEDLLDFSRLERGRRLVTPKSVDLAATTAQVLERLSVVFAKHQLATDIQPTGAVLADHDGLERILTNLVSNAVRYSPPGSTVTVRTAAADRGGEVIVDDEGPGVPVAERSKVFARFFRGTSGAVMGTRGTGIGLAVVKEYVDQMGGAVSVDAGPAGGARFRVWFAGAPTGVEESP